ncbi:MAG: hypothetical protein IJV35_05625 [Neisseriaceae bacterium]|nr:hypothetical protein [Neisseriaceae bacterium]
MRAWFFRLPEKIPSLRAVMKSRRMQSPYYEKRQCKKPFRLPEKVCFISTIV